MAVGVATLNPIDIAVLVGYFLVVIAIGFYAMHRAKRGTVSGYFLAGRFMTWLPVGASLFASNIGTEHFVGLTGSGAAGGLGVGVFEVSSIATIQALAWIFLPVYIASGCNTLPEYLGKRLGGQRIRTYLAVLSLLMYIFTRLSVDLFSSALFMKTFFGWNLYSGVFLVLGMTALCTVTGGLAAVMYTETLQCALMIFGGLFISIYSFVQVGGYEGLMTKYWTAVPNDTSILNNSCGVPSIKSFTMLRELDDNNLPWLGFIFGQMAVSTWYWAADQLIVQRALAGKDISHAQGGTILTGYFKILPMFLMVFPGMISRILYPDDVACVSNCKEVCGSESGCSNIAFPKLVLELLPVGFRGLIFAVFLAALMGNISAIFNSSSTIFTMDIYSKIRRNATVRELMIVGRAFVVVLIICSILWMPVIDRFQNGQLFLYMQNMFAYMAPPIAVSFIMAVLWPRANEPGVFWASVAGMLLGAVRMILDVVYPAPGCGHVDTRPVFCKLHFMYFAMILSLGTASLIIIISLLTKPPDASQLIRTTYWSRKDRKPRADDYMEMKNEPLKVKPSAVNGAAANKDASGGTPTNTSRVKAALKRFVIWFCGFDKEEQSVETDRMEEHLRNIRNLDQKSWQVAILLTNSIFLLTISFGLITFFSIWSPQIALRYKPSYNLTSYLKGNA